MDDDEWTGGWCAGRQAGKAGQGRARQPGGRVGKQAVGLGAKKFYLLRTGDPIMMGRVSRGLPQRGFGNRAVPLVLLDNVFADVSSCLACLVSPAW